ncbi:MAG: diacylglycerol kinase family protein [Bacteroidales bacterium]|jgi:YegS/Rv2252/BmrU family lipid kinase
MAQNDKEKWAFIVNPISGNCFGRTMVPVIEEMMKKYDIDGEIHLTERPGHATELSRSFAEKGIKFIIAVGGDGTMNEVAKPLVNNENAVTGIIPAGTGNDFNQIPGFPDRFNENDWEIFFRKNIIRLDVGVLNDIYFLNGLGIGFDAEVAAQNYTEEGQVRKGGNDKYIWHIVKTLLFFREKRMIVVSDGSRHETDCFINTVSIGRRFAGSFFLTPRAIANDGLLDVCSIRKLNLFNRFRLLLKVPKGTHIEDKRVHYFQTSSIDLDFPQKVPYHVDGEIGFAQSFKIRIIPAGINIIYNPDGDHYFKRG